MERERLAEGKLPMSVNAGEKGQWRFSHVSAYTDNVCETFTDQNGKIHYRWLYPDGKIEYICSCHRFLNK